MKRTSFVLALALSLVAAACGDEETGPEPSTFDPPAEEPLTLTDENRGLAFAYSDALRANAATFTEAAMMANHVVVVEQTYSEDEGASVAPGSNDPNYDQRIETFYEDDRLGETLGGFASTYHVVDLQRLDREWLVDWEGGERASIDNRPDALNFAREDFTQDVIERIVESFAGGEYVPDALILGTEMEEYWLQYPEDWPNFAAFVRNVQAAVSEFYPDVRFGVGINWSNFVDAVVPTFRSQVEALPEEGRSFDALVLAWVEVLDPLYYDANAGAPTLDFFAFGSIPDVGAYGSPDSLDDQHYAGITTFFAEDPSRALPVAWFQIGWPLATDSSSDFASFLNRFLALNGGYPVELVSWHGFVHLLNDECDRLRLDVRGIGAPDSICFRGLYRNSGGDVDTLPSAYFGQ